MAEEFIFDSDDFITFCANFDRIAPEDLTDSLVEVNLQDLNDRWNTLQRSYKALCLGKDKLAKEATMDSARSKYENCTTQYHRCKSKMFDVQKTLIIPNISIAPEVSMDSRIRENTFGYIKVPPCDTEVFHGGYEEWPSFRDMFTAVYGEHPKLSPVQKLYHLRLKVRGQAAIIVKKYKLCGENFSLAWEALKARYENKRILVDNQLKILLSLKSIASESSEALQEIQTTINDCLAFLKAQNVSISDWDPILVYLCSTKLPHETLSLWEQSLKSHKDLPTWKDMDCFLSNRYEVVERLNNIQGIKAKTHRKHDQEVNTFTTGSTSQFACKLCNANHSLRSCPQFLDLDATSRFEFVNKNKICLNCLSYTHFRKDCTSKFVCSQCKRNHHSLLHMSSRKSPPRDNTQVNVNFTNPEEIPTISRQDNTLSENLTSTFFTSGKSSSTPNTLLPTAIVQISHNSDNFHTRAFLDQGSEKTFISKDLQQRLRLPTERRSFEISGMGGNIVATSNYLCHLTLYSEKHDRHLRIKAIVVPKITRLLPNFLIPKESFDLRDLEPMNLADPQFYRPRQVELLIGSDILPEILMDGVKKFGNSLMAQSTIFGWVLSGPVPCEKVGSFSIAVSEENEDPIATQLRKFWEQEELSSNQQLSKDDNFCESLFKNTTTRNPEGRYIVRLPFKSEFPKDLTLGLSRTTALVQYLHMEQSLRRKSIIADTYNKVLEEYLLLNHMKPTSSQEFLHKGSCTSYYLPHHSVLKPESTSTKVRVVFNASKRTSSGYSLNDVLHIGPTLQSDLMMILLNWRFYKFVFSGDIEKMYRQILVHPDDCDFQRILHRTDPTSPVKDFCLNTLTFGVNCSPYLAIRTLLKLAQDSSTTHSRASYIIQNETYVDDILSGGHEINSAIKSLAELNSLLESAGFPLRKITSNCSQILKSVPKEYLLDSEFLKFPESSSTKTLGIQWNAISDTFSYRVSPLTPAEHITKRQLLSTMSKLFDPAGWISPIIVQAKLLLQQLWLEGTKWDECVKPNALSKWNSFVMTLPQITQINIPRWLNFSPHSFTQIHGFCDASEKAFCAVIYLRIQDGNSVITHLLTSKTKVAPINPVSLPRLELCGAVLLSALVKKVVSSLSSIKFDIHLWCDSSIVLGWLEKPPCTWKTYVANRTAQIIRNVDNSPWRHVSSSDNPADLGSRGCSPRDLVNNPLWWHGPIWLQNPPQDWPKSFETVGDVPEKRKIKIFHTSVEDFDILNRFSNWAKAIRVISYIYRFYEKAANKMDSNTNYASKSISHYEFRSTKYKLISLAQQNYYFTEFCSLKSTRKISKKSSLYSLNPFIDNKNIMRADGRIVHSDLTYNERYPIILPVKSRYFQLFLEYTHTLLMHAEQNLMIRAIRQEFYVSRLKSAIKKCIQKCKICTIYKQKMQSQIMAALPTDRCSYTLPFTVTGVDFAGPFSTKTSELRNAPYLKSYVCVFVCFSSKAIHLELCSDLTTGSFRAAFTRFVGRRGLPQKLFSDNGTNFVGADRAISNEFREFIKSVPHDISTKYLSHGFQWSFIPANAPHMGGLWEAGVKSFKSIFRKVAQTQKYTFEQFTTLLTRIEAVLNSRPLSPMTENPQELTALTPGHFLRGAPLVALPEKSSDGLKLIDRWDKLKMIQHNFARRWKDEYIKEMHRRYKWKSPKENIKLGQLVVIKDDSLPPCEWRLGRIIKTHPGPDGRTRVADIKTQLGTVTRAISKICVLPFEPSPVTTPSLKS